MKKIFAIFAAIVSIAANSLLAQEQYESGVLNEEQIKKAEEYTNRKQNALLGKTFNALNDVQKAKLAFILNGHSVAGKWGLVFKADSLREQGVFSTPNGKFVPGDRVPDQLTIYVLTSNGWPLHPEVRAANKQYYYVVYNGMPVVEVVNNRAKPDVLIIESSATPPPIAPIPVPRTVTVTVTAPKADTVKRVSSPAASGNYNVSINGDNNNFSYNVGGNTAPAASYEGAGGTRRICDSGLGFQTVASGNPANYGYSTFSISSYSGYPNISLGGMIYVYYQNNWWNWNTRRICDSALNYQLNNSYYGNNQSYAYNTPKPTIINSNSGGNTGGPHAGSTGGSGGPKPGSTGKVFMHR